MDEAARVGLIHRTGPPIKSRVLEAKWMRRPVWVDTPPGAASVAH